jgi:cytochrome c551
MSKFLVLLNLIFFFLTSCNSPQTKSEAIEGKDTLIESQKDVSNPKVEGYLEGKTLYESKCSSCHHKDGAPEVSIYPPLKNSDFLKDNQQKIACIIIKGQKEPLDVNGKTYSMQMPAFSGLSAQEVSQIINYINNTWGNNYGVTTTKSIKSDLENCK